VVTLVAFGRLLTESLVVKNPLSPVEHPGGVGVNNELFEESLEQFVVGPARKSGVMSLSLLTCSDC